MPVGKFSLQWTHPNYLEAVGIHSAAHGGPKLTSGVSLILRKQYMNILVNVFFASLLRIRWAEWYYSLMSAR